MNMVYGYLKTLVMLREVIFVDRSGERQYCGNGRFANAGVFSFHPVKHIATGEGGMVTTNDEELYKNCACTARMGSRKIQLPYMRIMEDGITRCNNWDLITG